MLKPDWNEIGELLKNMAECNGGSLPELYRIGWQSYLGAIAGNSDDLSDLSDYIELRDQGYFLDFDSDPECNDPDLAISIGKHYFPDPNIPDGECINDSEFEGLSRRIRQDTEHFGGKLTMPFSVAWYGRLLGLHQCNVITDSEYEQLLAMLPVVEENPVKKVAEFMSRFAEV